LKFTDDDVLLLEGHLNRPHMDHIVYIFHHDRSYDHYATMGNVCDITGCHDEKCSSECDVGRYLLDCDVEKCCDDGKFVWHYDVGTCSS